MRAQTVPANMQSGIISFSLERGRMQESQGTVKLLEDGRDMGGGEWKEWKGTSVRSIILYCGMPPPSTSPFLVEKVTSSRPGRVSARWGRVYCLLFIGDSVTA